MAQSRQPAGPTEWPRDSAYIRAWFEQGQGPGCASLPVTVTYGEALYPSESREGRPAWRGGGIGEPPARPTPTRQ